MMKNVTLLCAVLGLSACSEVKNQAYYLKHIDEAETVQSECENQLKAALMSKDKEKVQQLFAENAECTIVRQALKEHRQQVLAKEYAERQAKKEAELKARKEEIEQQYGSLSWQEYAKTLSNHKCGRSLFVSAECQPMIDLYNEKTAPVVRELKTQGLNKLLAGQANYCKQDKRPYSQCGVWQMAAYEQGTSELAVQPFAELSTQQKRYCNGEYGFDKGICKAWKEVTDKQEKLIVEQFVQNYDLLKKTYNQCIEQIKSTKNWDKRHQLSSGYPCNQAQQARSKLQLQFDNFETKMD